MASRLSPVKALNVAVLLLLLLFHLAYTVVASPAALAESKQGEEVPCPLFPSSAPSKAAFEVWFPFKNHNMRCHDFPSFEM